MEDEEDNYREINSKYTNTNNILIRVNERSGVCNNTYNYIEPEDLKEERYYYYIIDIDAFNRIPVKGKHTNIFKFEFINSKKIDYKNHEVLHSLSARTYEWDYLSKKEYIAERIYFLCTNCDINIGGEFTELLKKLERLHPVDVFDLNAPIFDEEKVDIELFPPEFYNDDGEILVDLDGNKLEQPISLKQLLKTRREEDERKRKEKEKNNGEKKKNYSCKEQKNLEILINERVLTIRYR